VQVVGEWNTAVHVAESEGRPGRRPLTRAELQAFFDAADDHVERAAGVAAEGVAGVVSGHHVVQGDLRVGFAAAGGGDAGCRGFHSEPEVIEGAAVDEEDDDPADVADMGVTVTRPPRGSANSRPRPGRP
jgi:hypothetical protein